MRLLTFMNLEEIEAFEESIKSGAIVPNSAQKRLAQEVTRFVHGKEGLKKALQATKVVAPGSKAEA